MTGSRGAHEESGHFRCSSVQASWLQLSCHARSCPAYRPMPAGPPVITRGNFKKEGTNPLSTPPLGRCGPRLPMQLFQVGFRGEVCGGGCRSAVITALVRETPRPTIVAGSDFRPFGGTILFIYASLGGTYRSSPSPGREDRCYKGKSLSRELSVNPLRDIDDRIAGGSAS